MSTVRLVASAQEREAVYRMRYEISVEELSWRSDFADHARRRVEDPLDQGAHLFVAFQGGELIGALRTNYARSSDLGRYVDLYGLRDFGPLYPEHVAITTKLMIRPRFRRSPACYRLVSATYSRGLADGILVSVIECDFDKEHLYRKLGYEVHRKRIEHPETGPAVCMRMFLDGRTHGGPVARRKHVDLRRLGTATPAAALAAWAERRSAA